MPKTKKGARGSAPKNRYCIGAKLSEHKFLRLLRGLSENMPVQALAPSTHVSGKTIRATYRSLRAELASAVRIQPDRFGATGTLLFLDETLSDHGREILRRVYRSRDFRLYRKRHAPRLKDEFDERNLLINKAVRMFCAIALPLAASTADASGAMEALHLLEAIDFNLPSLRRLVEGRESDLTDNRCATDFLHAAISVQRHHFPELRLYEDFRRYLLKNPLGSEPR
ncbi:hypothetical protein A7A08_02351 [Methyloligella halotolerans]|uniref:Uncharacterized protein n=2 Tax=Methyloligella halotolerans TaxID=1177755 RepID=A0A1E2RWI5_9HYPH|nr:hypothetical protein A7A08_02351 [Methyloligella halotolerans]